MAHTGEQLCKDSSGKIAWFRSPCRRARSMQRLGHDTNHHGPPLCYVSLEKWKRSIPPALGRHILIPNWQVVGCESVVGGAGWWMGLELGSKALPSWFHLASFWLWELRWISSCLSVSMTLSLSWGGYNLSTFASLLVKEERFYAHFAEKVSRENRAGKEKRVCPRNKEFVHWHKQWNTQGGWIMSRKPEKTRERTNI